MLVSLLGIWLFGSLLTPATHLARVAGCPLFASEHERIGVNVMIEYDKEVQDYDVARLNAGWYLDYSTRETPPTPAGMAYVQVLSGEGFHPVQKPVNVTRIHRMVDANPGALWIAGNEPDRPDVQDSLTPELYAQYYHDTYQAIKQRDPTALVAAGAIVQPTPVRLRYLDAVLAAYRVRYGHELPTDVWAIHNFILREQLDSWGADIPTGLYHLAHLGTLYTLEDHGKIEHFKRQIVDFRRWMKTNGYRNTPLYVSEYGILMPDILGFPDEEVEAFMLETFDYMRTQTDPALGYPADGNRLVQAWAWYSLNDRKYDLNTGLGFNGNLFDHDSGQITPVGRAFAAYTKPLVSSYADPLIASAAPVGGSVVSATVPLTVEVEVQLANGGTLPSGPVRVRLWYGDPQKDGELLGTQEVESVADHCRAPHSVRFSWQTPGLAAKAHRLVVEITSQGSDANSANNRAAITLLALAPGQVVRYNYLPSANHHIPVVSSD